MYLQYKRCTALQLTTSNWLHQLYQKSYHCLHHLQGFFFLSCLVYSVYIIYGKLHRTRGILFLFTLGYDHNYTYQHMFTCICTYICMTTSTEGHTCSAHKTIPILTNICVHVYVHTCIYV